MITERDHHVLLEVRQNIGALDPESIIPWSHNGDFSQDSKNHYEKLTEGLYLTILMLQELDEHEPSSTRQLESIKDKLTLAQQTEGLMMGVRAIAHDKVRRQWPHA